MFNIGPQELLVILIVALVVVGPKRLPELGRTIGRGLNEFRKLQDEVKDMVKFDLGADLHADHAIRATTTPPTRRAGLGRSDSERTDPERAVTMARSERARDRGLREIVVRSPSRSPTDAEDETRRRRHDPAAGIDEPPAAAAE